jgi:hypothetical protein
LLCQYINLVDLKQEKQVRKCTSVQANRNCMLGYVLSPKYLEGETYGGAS